MPPVPRLRPLPPPTFLEEIEPRVHLWCGDAVQVMAALPAASVDMVFADPPFNVGYSYDVYKDALTDDEYLLWTRQWLEKAVGLLRPGGGMWVAIGARYQAEVKVLMGQVGLTWRDTVIWHYTFGPRQESKWTPSWVALHWFTKGDGWVWRPDQIRVPSARQLKYNDRRAVSAGKVPDNVWALLPAEEERLFQPEMNSWLESRVAGTFKERTGHPCQMPEAVLSRIIRATTAEGARVLDPFLGSGTTAAVARALGRRVWGIELSRAYLAGAAQRLGVQAAE